MEIVMWGFSMYGGYYAEYIENGEYKGIHADSYRKLAKKAEELGFKLKRAQRRDN